MGSPGAPVVALKWRKTTGEAHVMDRSRAPSSMLPSPRKRLATPAPCRHGPASGEGSLAGDDRETVVGKLSPLLLDVASELLALFRDTIPGQDLALGIEFSVIDAEDQLSAEG